MSKIAYYAHSHGSGHCRYADFVSSLVPGGIVVMTTHRHTFRHAAKVIRLEAEDVADDVRHRHLIDVPDHLHYSPVGLSTIRRRALQVLQTVEEEGIDLVIVDVSVEVAALLRASSVPYVYVKMFGNRNDAAHLAAYQGAMRMIAFYPEEFEGAKTPEWVKRKTTYLGFKPRNRNTQPALLDRCDFTGLTEKKPIISVVKGFGGGREVDHALRQIRARFPYHFLLGLGQFGPFTTELLDCYAGVVPDITPYLSIADVVVGACGSNLTAEVISLGKPFVPLPCERPYDEQAAIAAALFANKLGTSLSVFLNKGIPLPPGRSTWKYFTQESYADFFKQLYLAEDWREILRPEIDTTIPSHA